MLSAGTCGYLEVQDLTDAQPSFYFRQFQHEDAYTLLSSLKDPRVACGLPECLVGADAEQARRAWVAQRIDEIEPIDATYLGICEKQTDQLIGSISFDWNEQTVAFWIAGDYQRLGYGRAAVGQFVSALCDRPAPSMVRSLVARSNTASQALLESIGFEVWHGILDDTDMRSNPLEYRRSSRQPWTQDASNGIASDTSVIQYWQP